MRLVHRSAHLLAGTVLESLVEEDEALGVDAELPRSYDLRTAVPQCAGQIKHVFDQGPCGSCYGFAVVAAAGDRACVKDQKAGQRKALSSYQYSVQDLLSCGSVKEGMFVLCFVW